MPSLNIPMTLHFGDSSELTSLIAHSDSSSDTESGSLLGSIIVGFLIVLLLGCLCKENFENWEKFKNVLNEHIPGVKEKFSNWAKMTQDLGYPRPQGNLENLKYGLKEGAYNTLTSLQSMVMPVPSSKNEKKSSK